ncbi:CidB/LrgB family autolysis modulator [Pasteurellaceae bacterium LFhippo2]|nr:CidB/LrgB family autolysis modulator [Pasteurellaceae bacterium LFhippo2]
MIYLYSALSVVVFTLSWKLNKKLKSSILNTFILSLIFMLSILATFRIPFRTYYQGNFPINNLLGVSVVALAVPFYEQLPQIKKHWKKIVIIVISSTVLTMTSGVLLAVLFGASQEIIASLLPKSVTTAIAISIASEIGGNSAISAVAVSIAGITGSAFGIVILQKMKVTNTRAIGLSIGAVSHALGTARAMDYSIKAGSYSSVSLVLCGLLSSLIAPLVFKLTLLFFF